jgi:hypothetical protein
MKKLEDIPKKQIFNVPDGYFEKLPGIVQSRVTAANGDVKNAWTLGRFAFRYAVPAVVILAACLFWFDQSTTGKNAETILASLETQELVAYLDEADFTTEELLESGMLNADDVTQIEDEVYEFKLSDEEFDTIFDDVD